jgi:hypothetical protein
MIRRGRAASLVIAALLAAGCNPSLVRTEGEVKLDGQPVEGATVGFISDDDPSKIYSGFTDASGKFSLSSGEKSGIPAGSYKVTVVKTPKVAGAEAMNPSSPEYLKQMEKEAKDAPKAPKGAMPGMMPKMAPGFGGGAKSELPAIYAGTATTPLTAKVPSNGPIVLELKSKP